MPIEGQRPSAVARQRRLRGDREGSGPVPDTSSPARDNQINQALIGQHERDTVQDIFNGILTAEDGAHPNENQFASLSNDSIGKRRDDSVRQIELLNQTSTRVKLSRGQQCVVLGLCSVWVKDGQVSVYGAILSASVQTHRLFAPISHALPHIEALSGHAEFQLDSIDYGISLLPDLGSGDLWRPPGNFNQHERSYFILGDSFDHDFRSSNALRELDLEPWKPILQDLTRSNSTLGTTSISMDNTNSHLAKRRILICGKKSSGSSSFARCTINRLISQGQADVKIGQSRGVLLLDLNSSMPEMTPPGMIGLIYLTDLILGPEFTHVLPAHSKKNKVLKMHFVGDIDPVSISDWWRECVLDLVTNSEVKRLSNEGCDLIINVPTWMPSICSSLMDVVWSKLGFTHVICLDQNSSSTQVHFLQPLADASGCAVHLINGSSHHKLAPTWEHNIHMQSYFHLNDYQSNHTWWNRSPVIAGGRQEVVLRFAGEEAGLFATIVLSSEVPLEDTHDALENALVGIVSIKESQLSTISLHDSKIDQAREIGSSEIRGKQEVSYAKTAHLQRSEVEYIPRLIGVGENLYPLQADTSACIGLGIVSSVNIEEGLMTIITPISKALIDNLTATGQKLVLVVPKATIDGRFKTDWAWREVTLPFPDADLAANGDESDINLVYESSDSMSE